jgi:glycosyltransferase involved in cell wall biosynthesis
MPRILFLTESFHPVLGGGETHVRALGGALAAAGFPATVVTRRNDPSWPEEEEVDGIRVLRVPPTGPGRRGKYAMVVPALRALARERATYDLLVVRGTRVLGLPGLLAGRWLGKPVVLQAEINGELSGEVYYWGTSLARRPLRDLVLAATRVRNLLLRDAEAFVAMSRLIRDEFVTAGVSPDRVRLLPHGVDTERFRPASAEERHALRSALGWPQDALVITYTGRLLRGKGLTTLLAAFREVARAEPRARLCLVGSGQGQALSVEEDLHAESGAEGLSGRVVFTGRVANVEDHLRASDVFVFPSEFEALGLSLIEAAACGLPAIGSRTGGIVDVIEDQRSGLLVPPGDAALLGAALTRLLEDELLRLEMGARGREIVCARFDAAQSAASYAGLFQELAHA